MSIFQISRDPRRRRRRRNIIFCDPPSVSELMYVLQKTSGELILAAVEEW
jgi:hypothetical protein